jgi:hypothetical protein
MKFYLIPALHLKSNKNIIKISIDLNKNLTKN